MKKCCNGCAVWFTSLPWEWTPLDPTPTGMVVKRDCASCSSPAARRPRPGFVLSRRTPQLMSNPTPPADETPLKESSPTNEAVVFIC